MRKAPHLRGLNLTVTCTLSELELSFHFSSSPSSSVNLFDLPLLREVNFLGSGVELGVPGRGVLLTLLKLL